MDRSCSTCKNSRICTLYKDTVVLVRRIIENSNGSGDPSTTSEIFVIIAVLCPVYLLEEE